MQKLKHHNSGWSDQCLDWFPTDTQELYEKNLQDPGRRGLLEQYGWIASDIKYQHNSHGFRTAEFDSRENFITVGCSHTYGVGMPQQQTWPELLSGMMDLTVYNLAVAGGSADTCYRVIKHYVQQLQPKFVAMLQPEPSRQEIFLQGQPWIHMPNTPDVHKFNRSQWLKHWHSDSSNALTAAQKNIDAIFGVCKKHNIDFYLFESSYVSGHGTNNFWRAVGPSLARDLQHPGREFHSRLATEFLTKISNKHTYE